MGGVLIMTPTTFSARDRVTVAPPQFPMHRFPGVVRRKTPNGYSVAYEAFGVTHTETFSANRLERRN